MGRRRSSGRGVTAVAVFATISAGCTAALGTAPTLSAVPGAPGCELFSRDTHWHQPVTDLAVHPSSETWIEAIGAGIPVHPDFGSGTWEGAPIGIPWVVVDGDQPRVDVSFLYADESDPGPYPIPDNPPIEGGPDGDGDRHILILDRDACVLYELFDAHPDGDDTWSAGSGAVFDLEDDRLRPDGWTSADAAGLPILPGLVRGDEIAAGVIDHAIRFTAPRTAREHVWPARHDAGRDETGLPPMGIRVRLRADVDLSTMSDQAKVIAIALQTYGAVLADNGSPWFLSGSPSESFDNTALRDLRDLTGSDFEVVDTAPWISDPDSRRVAGAEAATPAGRVAGDDRIATAVALSTFGFDAADAVVLARSDAYADALGATGLAAALAAPVVLTRPSALDQRVRDEIGRLGASDVHLVGGERALSPEIVSALEADGLTVHRWAGPDRYATATAAGDEAVRIWRSEGIANAGDVAVVALGQHVNASSAWPDALASGGLVAAQRGRLVLVNQQGIPSASRTALESSRTAIVAGGPAAVPDEVVSQLGVPARRVFGPDRFETALALGREALDGRTPSVLLVASGRAFPDALAATAAAAAEGGIVLLTDPDVVPPSVRAEARVWDAPTWVVGGPGAVSEHARRQLDR